MKFAPATFSPGTVVKRKRAREIACGGDGAPVSGGHRVGAREGFTGTGVRKVRLLNLRLSLQL
jgi:hypothetical protein